MSTPTPDAPAAAPKKKASPMLPIIIVAVVAAGGAGGGAWFFMRGEAASAKHEEPKTPLGERGLVPFEPFVVNLADPGGQRFLRASIQLVVENPEEAEHIEKTKVLQMGARAAILNVLTEQTTEHLASKEGKDALRKELVEKVHEALEEVEVVDVLFSDFVIQY
jgi:flagellar FliL protein